MVTSEIYIKRYNWKVEIYYAVTKYYTNRIMQSLNSINCPSHIKKRIFSNLIKSNMDTGFTYSNKDRQSTIMVIGLYSSPAQFLNSFEHELRHLVDDIAETFNLDSHGEEVAYLTGDLNSALWEDIHKFVCCKCNCKH